MSDSNDPKLGIEFVTTATGDGAKQAADAIKGVKQAASEATPAQQQLNQAGSEAVKVDEKVTGAKKGLTEGMRALRSEVPILGRAIDLLKSPFAALGAVIAVVWSELRTMYQKLDEAEARAQAFANLGAQFGKFQLNALNAKIRAQEFAKELEEIATKGRGAADMLAEMNELLSEQQRLNAESDSFEKGEAIAAIEARTDLSPEQKSAEKAKVERQFREAAKMRDREARWKEAQATKAAADAEGVKVGDAKFQIKDAIAATVAAQAEADKADVLAGGTAADFAQRAPDLLKKIQAAQQGVVAADRFVDKPPSPRHYGQAIPDLAARKKMAEEARGRLAAAQGDYDQLVNENVSASVNARVTRQKADEALDREQGLRTTIKDSTAEGHRLNTRAEHIGRGVLRSALNDRDAERSRPPGGAGSAGADGLASAGGQMDRASGEIAKVASGLNTSIDNLTTAIQQMGSGAEIGEVKRKLDELAREVRQQRGWHENNRL